MRKVFWVALLLLFTGCATATSKNMFGERYNEAISSGTVATIIKEGNFEEIRNSVFDAFRSLSYNKVLFEDPKQGFMVVYKDIPEAKAYLVGDQQMYRIILKFTKTDEKYKTRIDLVNATDIMWAQEEVDRDIRQLADIIGAK